MVTEPNAETHREKKMRAIDMLNHFINKRSQAKARSVSPPARSWKGAKLPPPDAERPCDEADVSPTPKRRRLAQSSPVRKPVENVRLSMEVQLNLSAPKSPDERLEGSPSTKSVAFSDKLDSSPTQRVISSSPRHTMGRAPSKSILRNPLDLQGGPDHTVDCDKGSVLKLAGRGQQLQDRSADADPKSLEYWELGEVHSMLDPNDLKEFQKIVSGGLEILSSNEQNYVARRFEVYASLNNIIPSNNTRDSLELANRKFDILIDNLQTIEEICLPHLRTEQDKLLAAGTKKNPFGSRIYIQIVRLFGSLLGHYRVMRALTKFPSLRERLREVLDLSKAALTHPDANKVIIGAQYSLLAYEKYGAYFFQKEDVISLVRSVINTKDIQSTNLICEKLHLMRKFLTKYTNVMLEMLPEWLASEVLAKILIDEEAHSLSILQAGIAVILDLLKKSIDSSTTHKNISSCIRNTLAKQVLPEELEGKPVYGEYIKSGTLTLENLIQKQITFLIIGRKEIKFAMDLWLAMMGLLYNTTDELVELSESDIRGWLKLNHICFLSESPSAKFVSLKAWRILSYYCWFHIDGKSLHDDHAMVQLLQRPFEFTASSQTDPEVREGILYYLTGIVFVTCGTSKGHDRNNFKFFWKNLIAPTYYEFIFPSESLQLKSKAVKLLSILINKTEMESSKSSHKEAFPLKVIASVGVSMRDIEPIPTRMVDDAYEMIFDLIGRAISIESLDWISRYDLFCSLLKLLPQGFINEAYLIKFLDLTSLLFSHANKSEDSSAVVSSLVSAIAGPFAHLVFSSEANFKKLILAVQSSTKPEPEISLRLLKELSRKLKGRLSEVTIIKRFLELGDESCKEYASNWVGSVLLPPTLTANEFDCFVDIVELLRSPHAIVALLDLKAKIKNEYEICELLSIDAWSDDQIAGLVKIIVAKCPDSLGSASKQKLKELLPLRFELFGKLFTTLKSLKDDDILAQVIITNPIAMDSVLINENSSLATLLPKNLPRETLSKFAVELPQFHESAQLSIIKWILDMNEPEALFINRGALNKCLFTIETDGQLSHSRKTLVSDVLEKLRQNKSWETLSHFIEDCLIHGQASCIKRFLAQMGDQYLEKLSPVAKAHMADNCERPNSPLNESIKQAYKGHAIDAALHLTAALMKLNKLQALSFSRDEFLAFFIIRAATFTASEQAAAGALFNDFLDLLMSHSDELILFFADGILSFAADGQDPYVLKVLRLLEHRPALKQSLLNDSKKYLALPKKLPRNETLEGEKVGTRTRDSGEAGVSAETISLENAIESGQFGERQEAFIDSEKAADFSNVQVPATQKNSMSTEALKSFASQCEVNSVTSNVVHKRDTSNEARNLTTRTAELTQSAPDEVEEKREMRRDALRETRDAQLGMTELVMGGTMEEKEQTVSPQDGVQGTSRENTSKKVRRITIKSETNDDFTPVETDQDDRFLQAMQHKLERRPDESAIILEQKSQTLPTLQSPASDDIQAPTSSKLRIPIFNSSKLPSVNVKAPENSINTAQKDTIADDGEPEIPQRPLDKNLEELKYREDSISREATPTLRTHFPSKKARRLVSRIRAFTAADLSHLSPEEKRNMRIELLDFLMSLEHESGFYQ